MYKNIYTCQTKFHAQRQKTIMSTTYVITNTPTSVYNDDITVPLTEEV